MASLKNVYGDNFNEISLKTNVDSIINLFSSNIAHKEFKYTINTCSLWKDNDLNPNVINGLIDRVVKLNPKMRLTHINKYTKYVNIFPILISNKVEYFILTDLNSRNAYHIYITPEKMDVL